MCHLDDDLNQVDYHKIDTTKYDKKPLWDFIGHEDIRIFRWENKFYTCGVRRDIDTIGTGRMEMCEIISDEFGFKEITRDRIEVPEKEGYLEKKLDASFRYALPFYKTCRSFRISKS